MKSKIAVPTLLLDRQKCQHNIQRMSDKARRLGLTLRPHFKTHQSSSIGRWFRQAGVDKITVSSLRMAEYFANDHWLDITVAFPVNLLEIDLINRLAAYIRLNLLVESVESVQFLDRHLRHPVGVFIKIDVGTHRTGVEADDEETVNRILEKIGNSRKIRFLGFLAHAGHTYRARGIQQVQTVHEAYLGLLATLREHYLPAFPELILSVGDTPSCSLMEDFPGVHEIRPGNFVFYDVMQIGIGSCSPDDVAVAMACPVVATHPSRNEIVVYGAESTSPKIASSSTARKIMDSWWIGNPMAGDCPSASPLSSSPYPRSTASYRQAPNRSPGLNPETSCSSCPYTPV